MNQNIKNHYKVLDVPRSASTKDIKSKTKTLLHNIKVSNISVDEKKKLLKKVYESYNFLSDYHLRKSLDEQLDLNYEKQYKIINDQDIKNDNPLELLLANSFSNFSLFDIPMDEIFMDKLDKTFSNKETSNYYSGTVTTTKLGKNGKIISKTKQYVNDNGKEDTKEYTQTFDNDKLPKPKIKPITFIL